MSHGLRMLLFACGAAAVLLLLVGAAVQLPPVGAHVTEYGQELNRLAYDERHTTDAVTAVNFDLRGFDTLGEELILFAAVTGVALLLRRQSREREEEHEQARDRDVPGSSDAVRALTLASVLPLVVFGLQLITHGHLTPGGGFQGGVVLATTPLVVFLAGHLGMFHRISPHWLVSAGESLGAGGFAVAGFAGLAAGATYLANVLPLGTTGELASAGLIPVLNVLTGLAVAGGFVSLMHSFLEETLELRDRSDRS